MRIIQFIMFFCVLLVPVLGMAEQDSQELFSCNTVEDCELYEESNCCMPWLTAVNRNKIADFEQQSINDRKKYEAVNCMCIWQEFTRPDQLQCIEKIRKTLKCLKGKCELPFKDINIVASYCKGAGS